MECKVWSVECGVWSVKCGRNVEHEIYILFLHIYMLAESDLQNFLKLKVLIANQIT